MVRQGAMAARDTELAELFETCHEETWNQLKWIKTKIKEASAQVLVGDEDDQLAMAGRVHGWTVRAVYPVCRR